MLVGRRRRRTGTVLRHERIELFLVLGVTQAIEEILELDLLLFKPLQCVRTVVVEGAVAARRRPETEAAAAIGLPRLHVIAHPLHLVLHPLHLVRPAILMTPATHFSAPECEKEKTKADRPPDEEAEYRHGNPTGMPGRMQHARAVVFVGGAAPSIDISGVGHLPLHHGNMPL